MAQYNWSNLSDFDFEAVCRDVMAAILGAPVELFARGRDKGIDLRAWVAETLIIGQAKHYHRSTFSALKRSLGEEVEKLKKMPTQCNRYLLFTSQPITPENKSTLLAASRGYIKDEADILGLEDIEGIIVQNEQIERHHYKLWLSSVRVLEQILGNATVTRSEMRIQELLDRSRYYVPHARLDDATKILADNSSLIISGPAGIGKTTMAEMLALKFLASGTSVHFVTTVTEMEQRRREGTGQLFVYDDFLGRTNFREAPSASQQEQLFLFMRHAVRSQGLYVILTTREYLYREAKATNERFSASRADLAKCLLGVEGYGTRSRAQILYNHLYWADRIPAESVRDFVRRREYMDVIKHPNFNPRWIADTINRLEILPKRGGGLPWT